MPSESKSNWSAYLSMCVWRKSTTLAFTRGSCGVETHCRCQHLRREARTDWASARQGLCSGFESSQSPEVDPGQSGQGLTSVKSEASSARFMWYIHRTAPSYQHHTLRQYRRSPPRSTARYCVSTGHSMPRHSAVMHMAVPDTAWDRCAWHRTVGHGIGQLYEPCSSLGEHCSRGGRTSGTSLRGTAGRLVHVGA